VNRWCYFPAAAAAGRFKSKARPYWVQFRDASGAQIDCVMKSGDDLRQDQVCFLVETD
jgi:hypothetical protein